MQSDYLFRNQDHQIYYKKFNANGSFEVFSLLESKGKALYRSLCASNNLPKDYLTLSDFPVEETFLRVASLNGCYYHDLITENKVVKISSESVDVIFNNEVNFERTSESKPLPLPNLNEGNIHILDQYLNLNPEQIFMVKAYIIFCLIPMGAFPVLALNGSQGSTKSSMCRFIKSIIDPSKGNKNGLPMSERDLAIAAQKQYLLVYDNVRKIKEYLADCFCRMATGGSFQTRKLQTDCENITLEYKRPLLLNGISHFIKTGDLQSRSLRLHAKPLSQGFLRSESEIEQSFQTDVPRILGGFYNLLPLMLSRRESVVLDNDNRLTDFYLTTKCLLTLNISPSVELLPKELFNKYVGDFENILDEDTTFQAIKKKLEIEGAFECSSHELVGIVSRFARAHNCRGVSIPCDPVSMGLKISELEPLFKHGNILYESKRNRRKKFSLINNTFLETNNT